MTNENENPESAPAVPAVPAWRLEYLELRRKLASMMEAHKITVTARREDSRPDDGNAWSKDSVHAAFEVIRNGYKVYSGHYSAGSLAALPDDLKAFRAAYTKGRGKGWNPDLPSAPGFHPDVKKAFDRRQNMAKTSWESAILECVRRAWLPEPVDVIQSLLVSGTDESFDDFCSNFGMDTDSRKALAMWEDCREVDRICRAIFGSDLDTAREIAQAF